ncbi:MAG TPA: SdpI family protein [Thermoanaerobaculia bacterium]|nr:SdpI family protein [Thermoanaerobaculia bacterium]
MRSRRFHIVGLLLLAAAFILSVALYNRLPDPLPTHWDIGGEANGFTPKPWGPFLSPLLIGFIYVLFAVLPRISPREFPLDRFGNAYDTMGIATMAFIFIVSTFSLLQALSLGINFGRVVVSCLGVFLAILGNYMGKVTPNFFVGIRTPWTLSNTEVWLRTHRLAGKLTVAAGLTVAILGAIGVGASWVLPAILIAVLIPVIYSYVIYRRLSHTDAGPPSTS